MPRSYAVQFRVMVIEQVRSGRPVSGVAVGLDLPAGTVFRWGPARTGSTVASRPATHRRVR